MARYIILFLIVSLAAVSCSGTENNSNLDKDEIEDSKSNNNNLNKRETDEVSNDTSSNDFQDIISNMKDSSPRVRLRRAPGRKRAKKGGPKRHKAAQAKKAREYAKGQMKKLKKFIRKAGKRRFKPQHVQANYNEFRKRFRKKAIKDPKEAARREEIYQKRRLLIEQMNKDYIDGKVSFVAGATRFADWDHDDFVHKKNGLKLSNLGARRAPVKPKMPTDKELPKEVDWRKTAYISPVEEQGDFCKSCWAFAAGSTIETYLYAKHKIYANLSRQNLVDCAKEDGCEGGHMLFAYNYTINNKGINSAFSYPYEGMLGRCRFKSGETIYGGQTVGYERLPSGDEQALKEYVAHYGPVTVGVDAAPESWQVYKNDLLYDETCTDDINHAVVIVGYGTTEEGEDYWLIKNSWGNEWGDEGYVKLARNRDNHCGVASDPVYPVIQ